MDTQAITPYNTKISQCHEHIIDYLYHFYHCIHCTFGLLSLFLTVMSIPVYIESNSSFLIKLIKILNMYHHLSILLVLCYCANM